MSSKPASRGVYALMGVLVGGAGIALFSQWTGDLLFRPPSNEPIRMEVNHRGQVPVIDKKLEIKPPSEVKSSSDSWLAYLMVI